MTNKLKTIAEKYNFDSAGAFGSEKNPIKKREMRQAAKNNPDLEELKKEYERVRALKQTAGNVYSSFSRLRSQGPAIKKAYKDMIAAIDRLWAVVEMRGMRIEANK